VIAVVAGIGSAGLVIYHGRHAVAAAQPAPSASTVITTAPTATPTPDPSPTPTPAPTPQPHTLFKHLPNTGHAPTRTRDPAHEE
jgi:large repetitive protein